MALRPREHHFITLPAVSGSLGQVRRQARLPRTARGAATGPLGYLKAKEAEARKVPQSLPGMVLGETGDAGKLGNCQVAIFVEVEEAGKDGRG